jgi:hypothetical protein
MNWFVIIPVAIACIALIIFIIISNNKDRKELENRIKHDYHKPPADYNDTTATDVNVK